jgi:cation:H+ antiporter
MNLIPDHLLLNIAVLAVAFVLLSKGADYLVNGSVGVAWRLKVPKVIIGIVLVSFGTTMPEFTVSVVSAVGGHSEIALGNAIGSIVVNVGIALALAVLVAKSVFRIDPSVYRSVGITFLLASILSFVLSIDGTISRLEGVLLVVGLAIHLGYLVVTERRRQARGFEVEAVEEVEAHISEGTLAKHLAVFVGGLAVVIVSSRLLVESAVTIAERFGVSETVIGLTIIAIGTSLPEIATCVVASRKGHGDLAFGDIMGANILNLLWITGGASIASPIVVSLREIYFMYPSMALMVGAMFLMAAFGRKLSKLNAVILVILYVAYAVATVVLFVPAGAG